uniref:glycerol kinase n=1 Tax=Arcella intermedia TaxID=1963864 RepID=A0A6B2L249_9EUKA
MYNEMGEPVLSHQEKIRIISPHPGWVEQDPMEILELSKVCLESIVDKSKRRGINLQRQLKAVGITNQRETTILWDPVSGKPLCNAVVWSDKRNTDTINDLVKNYGDQNYFRPECGLPISTYFSATKLKHKMDTDPQIKKLIKNEQCKFGTVDSWVIWNLTGGPFGGVHVTDVTNASRTMLMNLDSLSWSPTLCSSFSIPLGILPQIKPSSDFFGLMNFSERDLAAKFNNLHELSGIPINGVIGDQQSALVGQNCLKEGQAKTTYGTGCFMLFNSGARPVPSRNGLLTTVAYQFALEEPVYALEGSVAVAGSGIDWLKDNLGIIKSADEIDEIAGSVSTTGGVYFVPAFGGLFAPYWRADATGLLCGLNQSSTKAHIIRAFLKAVCFQNMEVLHACRQDSGIELTQLCVDGGMSASKQLLQIQSDLLNIPVIRPADIETTARGAAIMAAVGVGLWKKTDLANLGNKNALPLVFNSKIADSDREELIKGWKRAARLSYAE